jgi:hypothetical protein
MLALTLKFFPCLKVFDCNLSPEYTAEAKTGKAIPMSSASNHPNGYVDPNWLPNPNNKNECVTRILPFHLFN